LILPDSDIRKRAGELRRHEKSGSAEEPYYYVEKILSRPTNKRAKETGCAIKPAEEIQG